MLTEKSIQIIMNLLEIKNMKQAEFAKKVGIYDSAMSRILNGTRKVSSDELEKMADVFDVTTDYLLGRKVNLGNVPVAAHFTDDDLTEQEEQEINDYIEFKKAQYKKRHETKNK